MRKNVLFIAHDSSLYGANQSLINMLSSLRTKTLGLTVVFPDRGPICNRFEELGWEYSIVKFRTQLCGSNQGIKNKILNVLRYSYKTILNPLALLKLKKLVKQNNTDIIHSNSSVIDIGFILARFLNLKHVWHLREYIDLDHGANTFGGLEKYKIKIQNSDQIICITKGIAKHFGVENKAFVLYDAVRQNGEFIPSLYRSNYFLFCGSLAKGKGVEMAIRAFHQLGNNNLRLLIVGSGNLKYVHYLKTMVKEFNLQNNVEFLGFRDDIDYLMSNALAFLMCSRNEALGRVTVEAMLNYCIVIGYNSSGTAELIKHGKTGFLYDNIEQLVDSMNESIKGNNLDTIRETANSFACHNFLEDEFGRKLFNYYNSFN